MAAVEFCKSVKGYKCRVYGAGSTVPVLSKYPTMTKGCDFLFFSRGFFEIVFFYSFRNIYILIINMPMPTYSTVLPNHQLDWSTNKIRTGYKQSISSSSIIINIIITTTAQISLFFLSLLFWLIVGCIYLHILILYVLFEIEWVKNSSTAYCIVYG